MTPPGGLGLDVGQERPPGTGATVRLQHSNEFEVGERRLQPFQAEVPHALVASERDEHVSLTFRLTTGAGR